MVFSSVEFLFVYLPLFLLAQNFLPHRNLVYALLFAPGLAGDATVPAKSSDVL